MTEFNIQQAIEIAEKEMGFKATPDELKKIFGDEVANAFIAKRAEINDAATTTDTLKGEDTNKTVDEVKSNNDSDSAQVTGKDNETGDDNAPVEPPKVNDDSQSETTLAKNFDKVQDDNCDVLRPPISDADIAAIKSMSASEQNSLKLKINQFDLRAILPADKRGDGFICPICGNGSGRTGDGIKPKSALDNDGNYIWLYHCFARGDFNGDLIKIIATLNNLNTSSDFQRILAIGKKIIENPNAASYAPPKVPVDNDSELSDEELKLIQAAIETYAKNIEQLPIEDRRGISLDTYKNFNCGYCAQWVNVKSRLEGKYIPPTRRIIIPTSNDSYNAILPKRDRNESNIKYKAQNAGRKHIFNVKAIVPNKIIIAVEGEFDAMSIWQESGVNAIGIGGASSYKKLIDYIEEKIPADSRTDYQFIVVFDNDSTGIAQSKKLVDALIKIGCPATADFLSTDAAKIDANDILTSQGGDALKARVKEIINAAQIELAQERQKILQRQADKIQTDSEPVEYSQKSKTTRSIFKN